jgi:HEPN domain-containing protein
MNRIELQQLSKMRLKEAKLLMANGFPSGAYYLAGYAIECALKACIAKKTPRHDFPDKKFVAKCHTHDLKELIKLSQMESSLELEPKMLASWLLVRKWSEESRYRAYTERDAQELLDAVANRNYGVMPWITRHW